MTVLEAGWPLFDRKGPCIMDKKDIPQAIGRRLGKAERFCLIAQHHLQNATKVKRRWLWAKQLAKWKVEQNLMSDILRCVYKR